MRRRVTDGQTDGQTDRYSVIVSVCSQIYHT
jgi:hypothetical protein